MTDFTSAVVTKIHREQLERLRAAYYVLGTIKSELTDKEAWFLDDMNDLKGDFTQEQGSQIEQLYKRAM